MPDLKLKLGELQREVRRAGLPVIVVFEGWDAASMAGIINQFLLPLDPRGFSYHNIGRPDQVESQMPFMWRFWMKTPWKGQIAVFDRSWYSRAVTECLGEGKCKALPQEIIRDINGFEKVLTDGGTVLIKLFLHTSLEEGRGPRKRSGPVEACGLIEEDLDTVKNYRKHLPLLENLMEQTDHPNAPWTIVEADDLDYAEVKVMRTAVDRLSRALNAPSLPSEDGVRGPTGQSVRASMDLGVKVSDEEYKDRLEKLQAKLRGLQCDLYGKKRRLVVVFEGRDASGKGGDINRLTQTLNPRTYEVVPTTAPDDMELAHHYLWRFHRRLPLPGHIAIFDRSWYGRVLVERVNKLTPERDWRRAYAEINDFENMLVENDSIVVKLWLEVDKETQLRRFIERVDDPRKVWKISQDDWDARERWDQYTEAIDEMLLRTSTTHAPWTIVESNDKNHSRLKTLRTIIEIVERKT
jgi:polyphosphate:AMP phosphotransferase